MIGLFSLQICYTLVPPLNPTRKMCLIVNNLANALADFVEIWYWSAAPASRGKPRATGATTAQGRSQNFLSGWDHGSETEEF